MLFRNVRNYLNQFNNKKNSFDIIIYLINKNIFIEIFEYIDMIYFIFILCDISLNVSVKEDK